MIRNQRSAKKRQPKTPFASFEPSRFNDKPLAEKTIEDILLHFGETKRAATKRYREFVEKGIKQGTREDLRGGGLIRSAGGDVSGLLGRKGEERPACLALRSIAGREKRDARILGSGDFVTETLEKTEVKLEKKYLPKRPIEELVEAVAGKLGVKPDLICSGNKQRRYAEARSLVAFLAVEEVGHPAADVARFLGVTRMGVQKAVMRGSELQNRNPLFEN